MKYVSAYLLLLLVVPCAAEVWCSDIHPVIKLSIVPNLIFRLIWMLLAAIQSCPLKSEQSLKVMTTQQLIFHHCRRVNRWFSTLCSVCCNVLTKPGRREWHRQNVHRNAFSVVNRRFVP
jgi:hypothetical protein